MTSPDPNVLRVREKKAGYNNRRFKGKNQNVDHSRTKSETNAKMLKSIHPQTIPQLSQKASEAAGNPIKERIVTEAMRVLSEVGSHEAAFLEWISDTDLTMIWDRNDVVTLWVDLEVNYEGDLLTSMTWINAKDEMFGPKYLDHDDAVFQIKTKVRKLRL